MAERPLSLQNEASRRSWLGTGPQWQKSWGWQLIVADSLEPAHIGVMREHEIADAIAAGGLGPSLFIWRCRPALIVARSQTGWPGCAAATSGLAELGWPVLARRSGGGAFPICPGTVQLAMIAKYADHGVSMDDIYERFGFLIGEALAQFGIAARVGETPAAFCCGRRDLAVGNRKIAGLAQHWRLCGGGERCITAAASVLVDVDLGELTGVVARFHAMCGQTIDVRSEAMTTVAESLSTAAPPNRDLTAEFLAQLAALCGRKVKSPYS